MLTRPMGGILARTMEKYVWTRRKISISENLLVMGTRDKRLPTFIMEPGEDP